jgi:hypothetical protein
MNLRLFPWLPIGLAYAAALAGCSRSAERPSIPDQEAAKQAIETVLKAWQSGQAKSEKLTLGQFKIEVKDPAWSSGQKLKAYEIGDEEPQGLARWFTVKLTLSNGQRSAKYAVVGKDPIWIYAEEEFRKLSAWGDDPLKPPPAPTRPGRPGGT